MEDLRASMKRGRVEGMAKSRKSLINIVEAVMTYFFRFLIEPSVNRTSFHITPDKNHL